MENQQSRHKVSGQFPLVQQHTRVVPELPKQPENPKPSIQSSIQQSSGRIKPAFTSLITTVSARGERGERRSSGAQTSRARDPETSWRQPDQHPSHPYRHPAGSPAELRYPGNKDHQGERCLRSVSAAAPVRLPARRSEWQHPALPALSAPPIQGRWSSGRFSCRRY